MELVAATAVAIAALLGPGIVLLVPWRVRGLALVALAPAVTLGTLVLIANAQGFITNSIYPLPGVAYNITTVAGALATIAAVNALLAVAAKRRWPAKFGRGTDTEVEACSGGADRSAGGAPARASRRGAIVLTTAITVAGLAQVVPVALAMRAGPPQAFDAVHHLSLVQAMRQTEFASLVGATVPLAGGTPHYYPNAILAFAALLPGSTFVAYNAATLAILGLWPVAASYLSRAWWGRRGAAVAGALISVGIVSLPTVVVTILGTLPYGASLLLVPAAIGAALEKRWVMAGGAALAVAAVHPTGLYALAIFALALAASPVRAALLAQGRRGGGGPIALIKSLTTRRERIRWALAATATVTALIAAVALGARNAGYEREPTGLGSLALAVLFDRPAVYSFPIDILGALPLLAAGALTVYRLRKTAREGQTSTIADPWRKYAGAQTPGYGPALTAALLTSAIAALAALPTGPLRLLAAPWYYQISRMVPIIWLALAVLAVPTAIECYRYLAGNRRRLLAVAAVVVVLTGGGREVMRYRVTAAVHDPGRIAWGSRVTPKELKFQARVAKMLPRGAIVLADPAAGAQYLYALHGIANEFPTGHYWKSDPVIFLQDHLLELGEDPRVCEALNESGITHLYYDHEAVAGNHYGVREPEYQTQFTRVPARGVKLLASDGPYEVYEILACSGENN